MTEGRTGKRKWDQDDQGQSAKAPVEATTPSLTTEPALSAASEIAAKIKASLEAKGVILDEKKEVVPNDLPVPAEPVEPIEPAPPVVPSNEPSLLESLGINEEAKRVEKKPKVSDSSTVRKLDINDTRHRYYLTKTSTQEAIEKEFGVTVVSKGKYCPDRRLATEKDPPLYLEIHGKSEDDVDEAVTKLVILIEKGPPNVAPVALTTTPTFFTDKVFLNIEPTEAVPAFTIRGKILGPQGSFLKHIQSQSGCKVHLRGKGSGYVDLGANEEVIDDLHLAISSLRKEDVEQAKTLCEDLIQHIKKEVEAANVAKMAAAQVQYNQMGQPYGAYPQQQYYQQPYYPPPQGQYAPPQGQYAPPQGQYAYPPPPPQTQQPGMPYSPPTGYPYTSPPHGMMGYPPQYPGYYPGYPPAGPPPPPPVEAEEQPYIPASPPHIPHDQS